MRYKLPLTVALVLVVAIQAFCTLFFVSDIVAGVVGVHRDPLSWETRELMEIGAGVGLVLGVVLGAALLVRTLRQTHRMENRLREVSGAFVALLEQRFVEWRLTPSERDVAWFTIKGLSIAEIAGLRGTSEGTIKAQSNAIYRKAKVTGRTQLLSLFIEDLMGEAPVAKGPARGAAEGVHVVVPGPQVARPGAAAVTEGRGGEASALPRAALRNREGA